MSRTIPTEPAVDHHPTQPTAEAVAGRPPPEPDRPRSGTSALQVGAGALASVTAALGASHLGVGGTIAGAAFGSVVSAVAGSLYVRSLQTAGERLRKTGVVLVQRIPTGSERQPAAIPPHSTLTTAGTSPAASGALVAPSGSAAASGPDAAPTPDAPVNGVPTAPPTAPAAARKRAVLVLAGLTGAVFVLAMLAITVTEGLLGHPVSGGHGGTSVSRLVSGGGSAAPSGRHAPVPATATPSTQPGPPITTSPSSSASPTAVPSRQPTAGPSSTPPATLQPSGSSRATFSPVGSAVP